jgi:GAF domain-containing protein
LAAIRTAPSAAESIGAELEQIAAERKRLERALAAKQAPKQARPDLGITREAIVAFSKAIRGRLSTMDLEERRNLLALLGFRAIVANGGEVQASIAVPTVSENLTTTGRTWA